MNMKKIKLGKTELMVTPFGMGTLTMGFSQKNLSIEEGANVIVHAVRKGINFLDTAQYYDTYRYLRPALDLIRQDSSLEMPVICSKTLETDTAGVRAAVDECLRDLDLDVVDIFLLHEVRGVADFEERKEAWETLIELKKAGKIRAIGISTHHVDACERMALEKDCDVVFALINKAGMGIRNAENPGTRAEMEAAIRKASDAGVGIFTMKAFGGGNLLEDYVPCLDYATSIPGNQAVMIGLGTTAEVDQLISYAHGRMDASFSPDISGRRLRVDQSDCEGCGTCKARCVSHAIYWNENGLAQIDPDKCVRCGYCAPVCPVRAIIFL